MKNTSVGSRLIPFSSLEEASMFIRKNKGMYVSINLQALVDESIVGLLEHSNVYGYADGIGAQIYFEKKLGKPSAKIPGCELWLNLLQSNNEQSYSIAIIGASPETNKATVEKLKEDYPQHNINYFIDGYSFSEKQLLRQLSSQEFDFVFIALGQPRQELLGKKILDVIPNVTILGLGGSFDVYCGRLKRAPELFIRFNIEWLYRIIMQPKRSGKLFFSFYKYILLLLLK